MITKLVTTLDSAGNVCRDSLTFTLNDEDKDNLRTALSLVKINPYQCYDEFRDRVATLKKSELIPYNFVNICKIVQFERQLERVYHFLLRNLPVDENVPYFDLSDPLNDKYRVKTSFIGETLLELFSQLTNAPLIAYSHRSKGDFFIDIYARHKYFGTQTTKTDIDLYFHNDKTAHPLRPDIINLLGMRSHKGNRIYTSYIDGRNLMELIPESSIDTLMQPLFCTPFDYYSPHIEERKFQIHSIIYDEYCFRYTETKTTIASEAPREALVALLDLKNAILKCRKIRVNLDRGDLVSFPNQMGLHGREIMEIVDENAKKHRWLLKTYSLWDAEAYRHYQPFFAAERVGLILD